MEANKTIPIVSKRALKITRDGIITFIGCLIVSPIAFLLIIMTFLVYGITRLIYGKKGTYKFFCR